MSLDDLRKVAEDSLTERRRAPHVREHYGIPEAGAFVGAHTKFFITEPETVLALLDVAEAADADWVCDDPVGGCGDCHSCHLNAALARLREVSK